MNFKKAISAGLCLLGISATPYALDNPGPGLGNLTYDQDELFQVVSTIGRHNGVPADYPFRKHFGLNSALMHNGYFLTLFAPDSGAGPGGFLLYDVSNPKEISLVKRIYEPEGRTSDFREAHSIGASTINGRKYITIQTTKGIEFWDFTDVNNIQQVSKLALPGVNGGDYTSVAWQFWWQAPYVYVSGANRGVYIVDASDPAAPKIANRGNGRPNPVPPSELGGSRIGPIFTMGNHMLVSSMDQNDGFASLDISDPLNPVLLDKTPDQPQNYYATCFNGNKLIASVRGNGGRMVTYDISNPNQFVLENDKLVVDEQLYCGTQDNFVFQGAQNFVHKIDITNGFNYSEVGKGTLNVPGQDHGQVAPFGNLVFIGNDHGSGSGFIVHDINPDNRPPKVVEVSPRDGAKRQALTTRIGVAFTDSIDLDSANSSNLVVRTKAGDIVDGIYSVQLGIVNFSPTDPLLANTEYEVEIVKSGIKDYAGNSIPEKFISTFTTGGALDKSLTNHWPLDSDGRDIKGGNTGTPNSGSFKEGGYSLDGVDDHLQLSEDVSTVLGGTASMSFYMKTTQQGGDRAWNSPGIAGHDDTGIIGNDGDVFWGWIDNSGRLRLSAGNDTGIHSTSPINDNNWHHIVLTRNSSNGQLQMYVDGKLRSTGSAKSGMQGGEDWNRIYSLGQIEGGKRYAGLLDDIRIYNRVLTSNEVTQLHSSVIVSLSPETTDGQQTVGSTASFKANIKGNSSAEFSWNFGDGNISGFSTNPNMNHEYFQPGHYQVILTVRNNGSEEKISFTHTVTHPVTAQRPQKSSSIIGDGQSVFNVNPDNGTVTAIQVQNLQKRWERKVGQGPRSIAVGPNNRIWVAVQEEDKLVVLNKDGSIHKTISLAYGSGPYGITFSPDGTYGAVTLTNKAEVLRLNPDNGNITGRLKVGSDIRGIAIAADSMTAYITRFRSSMEAAEVYKVDLSAMVLEDTIRLAVDVDTVDGEDRARGVPNYLNQITISPDGRRAWVTSKKDNIVRGLFRDGKKLEHDKVVRSIASQIDLSNDEEIVAAQIDFNDRAPARAAEFSQRGDYVFVAQMESNKVEIVDAYSGSVRGGINATGSAPQGLYLDHGSNKLFVHNFLNRSVSVYDVKDTVRSVSFAPPPLAQVNTVANEILDANILRGKQIFYNAADTRMSQDGYMSCASCHENGDDDGMVWDFTDRGEGLRNTISLRGRMGEGHGRVHWTANFDEIQDFENDIRNGFGGTGFLTDVDFEQTKNPLGAKKEGRSAELDALADYVSSLQDYPRSPARNENGALTPLAQQGQKIFKDLNCASCHSGVTLQDSKRHDVGTIQNSSGLGLNNPLAGIGFDTPTLQGVWATAPYFHNGQAPDLVSAMNNHNGSAGLNSDQRLALVEYLKSLDGEKKYFRMRAGHATSCWIADGEHNDANIRASSCDTYNDQFWYQDILGRYHPKRNEDYCAKGRTHNNGWFTLAKCNNQADQQWLNDGEYIRNKANTNFVVDDYKNNNQVGMWTFSGANNQKWSKMPAQFSNIRNGRFGCLTATGLNNNNNVVVTECRDNDMQRWLHAGDGRVHLMANPKVCLDYAGQTHNGGAVVVHSCNGHENQKFIYDGKRLRAYKNRNYVVDASASHNGANVLLWSVNNASQQNWEMQNHSETEEEMQLVDRRSGKCLDVSTGKAKNGQNVQIWPCNNGPAQRWFYSADSGVLRSGLGDYCLDVSGGNFSNGGNLQIWRCVATSINQKFSFDTETLRPRNQPSHTLDATGTHSGANVVLWGLNGHENQRWKRR